MKKNKTTRNLQKENFPKNCFIFGADEKKLGAKENESCPFYLVLLCVSDETNLTNANCC